MSSPSRRLHLVCGDADVIPLPRRVEHSALRHAVLREARDGLILRHGPPRTTINGHRVAAATSQAVDDLTHAGCLAWTGDPDTGHVAGLTTTGRRQLAAWERPHRPGGDAA